MMASVSQNRELLKKHKAVIKRYVRFQLPMTLGHVLVIVADAAAVRMFIKKEDMLLSIIAGVLLAFMLVLFEIRLIRMGVNVPHKYAKEISKLPSDISDKLPEQFLSAKIVGRQYYTENVLIYFENNVIRVILYSDITQAAPKGTDLLLYLKDSEQPLSLSCPANGMAAIVYAYLRSKNPDITMRKESTE